MRKPIWSTLSACLLVALVAVLDHEASAAALDEPAVATTNVAPGITGLRCFYRVSDAPFDFSTRYVWATDPDTGNPYRLTGTWHGGRRYHWQALFRTDVPQSTLRSVCEDSLRRRGIEGPVAMYAAGDRSLAFAYGTWSTGTGTSGTSIDRVVAFGDSLSDTHDLYNASRWLMPNGTSWYAGRFTNGENWVEHLSDDLHVPLYDWAVGGVGVGDRKIFPWADLPGAVSQARAWRESTGGDPAYDPARSLFTVLVGGNDLIFFDTTTRVILDGEARTVQQLIDGGARNILVMNLPEVSRAPIAALKGEQRLIAAKMTVVNAGLQSMVASLQQRYGPQLNIQLFDTHALFSQIFDDPGAYGFTDATQSCLDIDQIGMTNFMERHPPRPECTDPNQFVFWDLVHPTTRTHEILATQVAAFVQAHFDVAQ